MVSDVGDKVSTDGEERICGVEGRSFRGYVYVKVLNVGVDGGRSVRWTMPWPDFESEGKREEVGMAANMRERAHRPMEAV